MKQIILLSATISLFVLFTLLSCKKDENKEGPFKCGISTVKDVDGNVYNTVLIGEQCWMKENLKTTKYRNNIPIEYPGNNNSAWLNNTTGAYAWYDNDISWKNSYGALYNWYATNNTNGLCPVGWHVPMDEEFTVLTNFLGGTSVAGGKMKSTRTTPDPHPRWESPNKSATNESGFTGLPGGLRSSYSGETYDLGNGGYWWSAKESNASDARFRGMGNDDGFVHPNSFFKVSGYSVRCLRDNVRTEVD